MAANPERPNFITTLLLATAVVVVSLVLSLVALINFPFRIIVKLTAKTCRPDLGRMLAGNDAYFAAIDKLDRPKLNIVSGVIVDGSLSVEELCSVVESRIINRKYPDGRSFYPELRQAYTNFLGYIFWANVKAFSLREHVRLYDYNDLPIGSIVTEDDIENVVGDLMSKPWEPSKSPWEFLLIPNVKLTTPTGSGIGTAIISRIHHGLADGVAITELLSRLNTRPVGKVTIPSPRWKQRSACDSFLYFLKLLFRGPWDLAAIHSATSDPPNPWHLGGQLSGRLHYNTTAPISIDVVKGIKQRHGVNFISVVYTVNFRSIARFLEVKGEVVPATMAAFIPAPLPSRPDGLTNHVSGFFTRFPLTIGSLKVHIKTIDAIVQRQGRSTVPLASHSLLEPSRSLPICLQKILSSSCNVTLIISIVPIIGKDDEVVVKEAKCIKSMSTVPTLPGTVGATISVGGCDGQLRFYLLIDQKIYPSRESFQDFRYFIEQEFQALNDLQPDNGDLTATDAV